MLKFFRWFAGFVLTLILLVALAAIILPRVIDPNDYRDEIAELVKSKTGRDLALEGDLEISVFPWLGIRTQGLSLSQPPQIGGDMVSVDTAQLRVKLIPLLSKQVEVDTVVLESPLVRIVTLADGTDSFSGLGSETSEPETDTTNPEAAVALVIQGLELSDGKIVLDDQQAGSRTEINDLNLITGNLIGAELASINASGVLTDATESPELRFELQGEARIDTDTLDIQMRRLVGEVTQGETNATFGFDDLSFTNAKLIKIRGLKAAMLGAQNVEMTVPEVEVNLEAQTAKLADISITSGELQANITNLKADKIIDAPRASGRMVVQPFDAGRLINEFEIDFKPSDPQVLKRVGLTADFTGGVDGAGLKNLVFQLDDSQLTGSASVANFDAPAIKFDLSLDQLNLDRYLPASEVDESEPAQSTGAALAVPMAVFKDFNANGRFRAAQLISGGLTLNDIDVNVVSTPGSVTITPKANLYQGKLSGEIAFTEKDGVSELRVQNNVDLVQLGEILQAADITDQLSGIGTLALDLLITEKEGVQSNEGTIKLLAKDGVIKGVDIKGIVDQSYATYRQLKGREPKAETGESEQNDETKFADLLGTFYLKDSILTNDDFAMKAPLFRLNGAGTINIEQQILDYLVNFSVVNSTDGQSGEALEKLKGITIPIRLSGDLTSPNYAVDTKPLIKGLVKKELDEKKSEYLEKEFGIEAGESGEKLSTKDALKQILIRKATKDDSSQNRERPVQDVGRPADSGETPAEAQDSTEPAPDVPANPEQDERAEKSTKEQAKDDLKKKLLEGLFK